jgi:hypothetical protein
MSATTDFAAPRRSLARRLRWWWLRRRSDAILQALPGRLRLDFGLPEGRAAGGVQVPARFEPGLVRRPR